MANADLPADIRRDFEEAAQIVDLSPCGAAALLRLSIQKLLKEVGCKGEDINVDIGALVAGGLDPRIQKALDIVRVVGNNAVHPGVIDIRDDKPIALKLFELVNLIAETLISVPKHIANTYETVVPETAKKQIEKRDKKS